MKFDNHVYNDQVYRLADPIIWKGEDNKTLCGIRRLEACAVRSY